MSSDAFADLGRGLSKFTGGIRRLMDANQRPAAGSPADEEADGKPSAGDWGLHPSGAVFATVLLTTWSCTEPSLRRGHGARESSGHQLALHPHARRR
jgi:hypothetical protein